MSSTAPHIPPHSSPTVQGSHISIRDSISHRKSVIWEHFRIIGEREVGCWSSLDMLCLHRLMSRRLNPAVVMWRGCGTTKRLDQWGCGWVPGALGLGGNTHRCKLVPHSRTVTVRSDLLPCDSRVFFLAIVIPWTHNPTTVKSSP